MEAKKCIACLLVSIWKTSPCQCSVPTELGTTCGQMCCRGISLGPHFSQGFCSLHCRKAATENQWARSSVVPSGWLAEQSTGCVPSLSTTTRGPSKANVALLETRCPHREAVCQMERQVPKLWHLWPGVFQLKVFSFLSFLFIFNS